MYLSVPVESVKVTKSSGHVNLERFLPPYPVNAYCVALVSPGDGWKAATHRRAAHRSLWRVLTLSPMPGFAHDAAKWDLVPQRTCRNAAGAVCIHLLAHVAAAVFASVDPFSHVVPAKVAEHLLNQRLNAVGPIHLLVAFCNVTSLIGATLQLIDLLSTSMRSSSSNDVSSLKGVSDRFRLDALRLVREVELDMLV
jgi:hypothetical protein